MITLTNRFLRHSSKYIRKDTPLSSHPCRFLVAFGANLSLAEKAPESTLIQAYKMLRQTGFSDLTLSPIYSTPSFPPGSGPDYVNAAAIGTVPPGWDAERLLALLHKVEAEFARQRTARWAARTLDLDLIAVGEAVLPDAATQDAWRGLDLAEQKTRAPDRLILPHPRMQDRAFVLVPLADVAPDWRHPILGRTVAEMRDALPAADLAEVRPLSPGA